MNFDQLAMSSAYAWQYTAVYCVAINWNRIDCDQALVIYRGSMNTKGSSKKNVPQKFISIIQPNLSAHLLRNRTLLCSYMRFWAKSSTAAKLATVAEIAEASGDLLTSAAAALKAVTAGRKATQTRTAVTNTNWRIDVLLISSRGASS